MGMTRDGRASSARSKNSRSIPVALREKTEKLAPVRVSVAPIGALRPVVGAASATRVKACSLYAIMDTPGGAFAAPFALTWDETLASVSTDSASAPSSHAHRGAEVENSLPPSSQRVQAIGSSWRTKCSPIREHL